MKMNYAPIMSRKHFTDDKQLNFAKFAETVDKVWKVYKFAFLGFIFGVFVLGTFGLMSTESNVFVNVVANVLLFTFFAYSIRILILSVMNVYVIDNQKKNIVKSVQEKYGLRLEQENRAFVENEVYALIDNNNQETFAKFDFNDDFTDVILTDAQGKEVAKQFNNDSTTNRQEFFEFEKHASVANNEPVNVKPTNVDPDLKMDKIFRNNGITTTETKVDADSKQTENSDNLNVDDLNSEVDEKDSEKL